MLSTAVADNWDDEDAEDAPENENWEDEDTSGDKERVKQLETQGPSIFSQAVQQLKNEIKYMQEAKKRAAAKRKAQNEKPVEREVSPEEIERLRREAQRKVHFSY